MGNIKEYYKNTLFSSPHKNLLDFISLSNKPGNAIDLGCGTGRDTVFLIKNGWNVLSIDRENTMQMISDKLNTDELKKFRFIKQDFESIIELEKNNLVVANFSIPFCDRNYFPELWNKIVNSISEERLFCRKLFWIK